MTSRDQYQDRFGPIYGSPEPAPADVASKTPRAPIARLVLAKLVTWILVGAVLGAIAMTSDAGAALLLLGGVPLSLWMLTVAAYRSGNRIVGFLAAIVALAATLFFGALTLVGFALEGAVRG